MSNCPGCDNSSTTYSRCNPPISTNCVFYQGDSKVCENDDTFTICKGDNLSSVQMDIFNKICTLIGDIDITTIQIPTCFYDSWNAQNPKESDKTLLNLLSYMLDVECQQKQLLDQVNSQLPTLDPQVQICLSCCTPEGACSTTATLLLSQALQKIVDCICNVKAIAENALAQANNAYSKATEYEKKIVDLEYSVCRLTRSNIALTKTVTDIVNALVAPPLSLNVGLTAPNYTGCPLPPANIVLNV
jgi:hypothetical protein